MQQCGIYKITSIIDGKIYIGYSANIKKRIAYHKSHLSINKHNNTHLQSAWKMYSSDNFTFEIIEECSQDILCEREHYWCQLLNTHDPNKGYNIVPTSNSDIPRKMAESTKIKIGKALKGRKVTRSVEHKTKLRLASRKARKVINIETNEIFNSITDAAQYIGIHKDTLRYRLTNSILLDNIPLRYSM